MTQFDTIFFALMSLLVFFLLVCLFFTFFTAEFSALHKVKMTPINVDYQKGLVLTIRNEISIRKAARISWIQEKLIEFYEI